MSVLIHIAAISTIFSLGFLMGAVWCGFFRHEAERIQVAELDEAELPVIDAGMVK